MKVMLGAAAAALGLACATKDPEFVQTQVISFPDGALVQLNGTPMGRAPARVTFPQDAQGRLTERAEIRVLPNSNQPELHPQSRIFEPRTRDTRVPNRIMVDMTRGGTNIAALAQSNSADEKTQPKTVTRRTVPYTERSKPTQAVGLDRWKPGIY